MFMQVKTMHRLPATATATATAMAAMLAAAATLTGPPAAAQTIGPQGESATPSSEVTVSDEGAAILKAGNHTAALLWHDQSDFVNAVTAGATDEFARFGIEVVATTNAAFDAAKQRSDIETALVKQPSVILSLPLDPVTSAEAFRQAVADGVKLVFLSNLPNGYRHGEDYAAIVSGENCPQRADWTIFSGTCPARITARVSGSGMGAEAPAGGRLGGWARSGSARMPTTGTGRAGARSDLGRAR